MFASLKRGVQHIKDNPQLAYSIIVAILIFCGFIFVAQQFIGIALDAQERLINVRVGSIQDTFVQFAGDGIDDPAYLRSKIEAISKPNPTIEEFKIVVPGAEGYHVIASLDDKTGGYDTENEFLYRLAASDTDHSYTQEYNEKSRFFKTVRAIVDPKTKAVIGFVYTTQSLSEADKIINMHIRNSILIFAVTVILIMLLFFRHAKIVDYMQLYRQLKDVDTMKDDFITMASHELRTPVTVIRGYAEYLVDEKDLSETEKKYALQIESGAKHLDRLVEDILNVSRFEQGRMKFEFKNFDPQDSVRKLVDSFMHEAENKGLKLEFETVTSGTINADPERFEQVLINLIGNALKYTKQGSIKVRITNDNNKVQIRVSDSGIGISASEQSKLFNKFYRVKSQQTAGINGTGLGLWITAQMVQHMNGNIWVESIEGVGSHFIVSFPIVSAKE